jgi:DNA invertase Pin-like site-specific DNA recombinase
MVLGIEMSRLARSGREWHQLLELCALSGALLVDLDGVYDPAEHNDRLLLGLKGTISEAELHLIKQRMWSGRITKAQRGELAVPLPIGYVRRPSGEVARDPDEQVRSVVALVFDLFERFGTIGAVLAFLADHHVQLAVRLREGPECGELSWRRPSRATVTNMLHNPAYAGIYAYGRSTLDPRRRRLGRPCTGRVRQERAEWLVFLPGLLPAYISVEQYERNLARMDANRARAESVGAVRGGPALLAGLMVCGLCGKKMTVRYQRGPGGRMHPTYVCSRNNSDYAGPSCQQTAGGSVDEHVSGLLLKAMAPAALEVSLAAVEQAEAHRAQVDRIWRQRLERADYNADRARRQYQLAEPENRLVVRQLEKDWEHALAERVRLGEEYDRFVAERPRILTEEERARIRALAEDIPGIWHAPTTTDADRKQLIRQLVEQVRIEVIGTSERVDVEVMWAGGHHTRDQITRPVACLTQLSYYPQLSARARELVEAGLTAAQIADHLNTEGFRPPKRARLFTKSSARDLLRALGLQRSATPRRTRRPALAEHEWWLRDLAAHLQMSPVTLDSWVRRGWADGYLHPHARLTVVRADPEEIQRLRALHHVPRGQHNRRRWQNDQAASPHSNKEGTDNDQPRL